MNKDALVKKMTEQHRSLQAKLDAVYETFKKSSASLVSISQGLEQFKKDLLNHFKVENEVFYPALLKEMKDDGVDTKKIIVFIDGMKEIEMEVYSFLKKYSSSEDIDKDKKQFELDFQGIMDALNYRIESEEAGVYNHWNLV